MGAKTQLDLIITFTEDIGMELGNDKCAYIIALDQKSLKSKFLKNELLVFRYSCYFPLILKALCPPV